MSVSRTAEKLEYASVDQLVVRMVATLAVMLVGGKVDKSVGKMVQLLAPKMVVK